MATVIDNSVPIMGDSLHQQRSMLSWRSILAGTVLTNLFYAILLSLGVAVGGVSMSQGEDVQNLGLGTGLWVAISAMIALFGGTYVATRSTRFVSRAIGMWQASVIAALFFIVLLVQMGALVGTAGATLGRLAGSAANAARGAASNPVVQSVIEDAFAGLNFQAPMDVVVQGVAVRILQGDPTSAHNYLARQAGITPEQAQLRIDQIKASIQANLDQVQAATGKAIATAGWSLFFLMVLGLAASIGGGVLGARENLLHPISEEKVFVRYHKTAEVNV